MGTPEKSSNRSLIFIFAFWCKLRPSRRYHTADELRNRLAAFAPEGVSDGTTQAAPRHHETHSSHRIIADRHGMEVSNDEEIIVNAIRAAHHRGLCEK